MKQHKLGLTLPLSILVLALTGCGSDTDSNDLSALCTAETTSIIDASDITAEIIYNQVDEAAGDNDDFVNAQAISKNDIVSGSLDKVLNNCIDCYDNYSFAVAAGDELEITLNGDDGTNFDIILFNTTGEAYISQSLGSTSSEKLNYTVPAGTTSLTALIETGIISTGSYTLTITSFTDATPIEPSTSELNGAISDAVSGLIISGASLQLRECGATTGDIIASVTSDASGGYSFADIETGTYTAEVSFDGYITEYATIALSADAASVKNFPLSEELAPGEKRVVLSWGASPSDLDSYLSGPLSGGGTFTIYYSDRNTAGGDAQLDLDDAGGFGPETITISTQNAGTYTYWVQDFSNRSNPSSNALANSGATVRIYGENGLIREINIPTGTGNKWNVFTMTDDTVTTTNTITTD
jgi:hypothetical protein